MAGCNSGATRSFAPGMANARLNRPPGMHGIPVYPCGPGDRDHRGEGASGCNAGATGAIVQGVATFMQMLTPAAPPPH